MRASSVIWVLLVTALVLGCQQTSPTPKAIRESSHHVTPSTAIARSEKEPIYLARNGL